MLLVVYALVLLLFLLALLRLKSWHDDGLPGPRRLPFIGMALELAFTSPGEILPLMKRLGDKFNGCVAFELIGYRYVLLYEPETIELLLSSSSHIKKGIIDYELIRPLVSDGLIISSGPKWRYRRKLLTPAFHFKILEDAMDSLNRNSEILASNLLETSGKDVEVEDIVRSSTLKIICETAMGVKLNETDQQQNEYITAIKRIPPLIMKRFLNFWEQNDLLYNFTPSGKRLKKYIGLAHSFTKKVIASRRNLYLQENNPEVEHIKSRRKAFLDCLLEMNIANETVISNEGICEEVDTFMFEGHDTTSTSLAFTIFLLANHPEVQEKVAQEMYKIFGEDDRPATLQDLNKMIYLEMVIKESLRLYPSVPFISRYLTEDLRISEDLVIPAGYTTAIPIYYVHRSKMHWEDPEEFRPERFTSGTLRHPFAFIPFSAGPRNCIGQRFAMMELKTVLSTIIRRCEIEAVTKKVTPVPTAVMCCIEPIKIKIHQRKHQNVILNY